ncbi:hypothetical protein AVEN_38623-1 [Araneus ventricosus]|uniref:Uncharacterized protein n=1 Tax=Araneus ventricosus TaxID=182803 RepID=A0A4Y2LLK2_ARAVE|nr:hypothetical protein AVEN_38623-1 [Araneus ventricosus]
MKLSLLDLLAASLSMMTATTMSLLRWIDIIDNPVNLSSPIVDRRNVLEVMRADFSKLSIKEVQLRAFIEGKIKLR